MSKIAELPPRPKYDAHCAPGFCSAYYLMSDPTYQIMRRNGVPTAYLTLTMSGAGFFRDSSDHVFRTEPGVLTYMDANTPQNYGIWPGERWGFHWVHLATPFHWDRWVRSIPSTQILGLRTLSVGNAGILRDLSDRLFSLHGDSSATVLASTPLDEALALNLVERTLLTALRETEISSACRDSRIREVLKLIQVRPYRLPSLKELAMATALSESRLCHVFKEQTGETLYVALDRRRFQEAKAVLLSPDISLEAAADRLKFSNAYAFSKWFLKVSGMRPGAFRKQASSDSLRRNLETQCVFLASRARSTVKCTT